MRGQVKEEGLRWLGIIKTEEEEIMEGIVEFAIEKFWVTPAGRRLINRMMEYFVEKGRWRLTLVEDDGRFKDGDG